MVDHCYLDVVVLPIMTSEITEVSDSIQSASNKYFAFRDLPNMFYSVTYFNSLLALFCLHLRETIHFYLTVHWGNPVSLLPYTVFVGNILTAPNFLQEHKYNTILMASSSKEIHLTYLLRVCKYS